MLDNLARWAHDAREHEICGLFFRDRFGGLRTTRLENVHETPQRAFRMDPAQTLARFDLAERQGSTYLGTFHSHPTQCAAPSDYDRNGIVHPDAKFHVIVGRAYDTKHFMENDTTWRVQVWNPEWTEVLARTDIRIPDPGLRFEA